MATRTVCDDCERVVEKIGKDYLVIPMVNEAPPDLHTGRSERTIVWQDVCIECFLRASPGGYIVRKVKR